MNQAQYVNFCLFKNCVPIIGKQIINYSESMITKFMNINSLN